MLALKYIIGNRLTSTNGRGRTDLSSDKGQLTGNFNPDRKWTVEVGPNGLVG
jgi:hypothetical protein